MRFKKISMNQGGLKGAEVHYFEPNDKGIPELTKKYPRNPVHLGLQKLFKDLRIHLLQVCQQVNDDMDVNVLANLVSETTVNTVHFDGDTIVIEGEKLVTSDKSITLKTYKLEEEDNYEHYGVLKELTDSICSEMTEYMSGNKKVPDAEIIQMWAHANHKEQEFTMDKLLSLPQDKLKKMAISIIEKGTGGIVIMPDDSEDDEVQMNGVIEELKTEFEITDGSIEIEIGNAPEPKKEKKGKDASVVADPSFPIDSATEEQF